MPKKRRSAPFGGRDITPGTKSCDTDTDCAIKYGGDGGPEPATLAKARRVKAMKARIQGVYSPNRPRR